MQITATEFKNNIGKYLALAAKEDIYITKNGKSNAKLTNTKQDKVEMAKSLFGILPAEEKINAYVTANSIADIYFLLRRHLHDNERCRREILKLVKIFGILDVTGSDCEKALELPMADYEDALLAACAKRGKMECIVTRNVMNFGGSPVRAVPPDDFLKSKQNGSA